MRIAFGCAAVVAVAALAGCGRDGPARSEVSGRVTFKGQPVSKGKIVFLIANGPTAMGDIKDGAYRIDHHGGVPVGSGKVEIESFQDTDKLVHANPTGVKVYETKQVLPPKYNTKTELTIEITRGTSEKNFDLDP